MNAPKMGRTQTQKINAVEFTAAELDTVSGGKPRIDRATIEWLKENYFP
jgi:hypothetical protein